ncbi:MAG: HDOD domain-containing protein [Myxococcales bacterium]|nr:HDOD domain-containing protein [Myxococcales bacterium]
MSHLHWGQPTTVEEVVESAQAIGAFPASAQRIREVADNPEASLIDLERVVAADPAVTAVVLRVANSAFFGLPRSVVSVKEALLVLGFNATKELALSIALIGGLRSRDPLGNRLWSTALRTGAASQLIGSRLRGVDRRGLFVAGLLHEIGALILLKVYGRPYATHLQRLHAMPAELMSEERATMGFDHPTVGGACLARWYIPPPISGPVRWHGAVVSDPDMVPDEVVEGASAVHLARRLQAELAKGLSPRDAADRIASDPVARRIGLAPLDLEHAAEHLPEEVSRLVSLG